MKINFEYYKKDIHYNVGKNQKKIIKYIMENPPSRYEQIINNDMSDEVIMALSTIRNNIVYAYEFKPNSSILEVGGHLGELTDVLCQKSKHMVTIETIKERAEAISNRCKNRENLEIIVGDLHDIKINEKFDYITLFGILEFAQDLFKTNNPAQDLIEFCKKLLKEDGKILIATNNKFAIKAFVGDKDECTNNTFDSITGYKTSESTYKLGKKEIEEILKKSGLNYYKFLYPLPDFKLSSVIFSDEYLLTNSKMNNYFPYYRDESNIFFSEIDAYNAIIQEDINMFKFFANSYFIEASEKSFMNDTKFISFNNYRKKKYRLMTKIKGDFVEKTTTVEESVEHIRDMKEYIEKIKKSDIKILDKYDDGKIISKFIKSELVSENLSNNLKDKEHIITMLKRFKDEMYKYSHSYDEHEKTVFDKYSISIDKEKLLKFKYLEDGYWDMIFKNCFLIDNTFYFFDQEWLEKNVPVEFLLYRCINNIEELRSKITEYHIYEKLNINEYIEVFKELDKKILDEIFDERLVNFYTRKYINPIYENLKLLGELNDEKNTTKELRKTIQNLSNEIITLKQELNNIYKTKTWKLIRKINKLLKK